MSTYSYTKSFLTLLGLFHIFIGTPSSVVAQAEAWVPCGQENGDCVINTTAPVHIRYGSGTSWTFTTAGVGTSGGVIPCNNGLGNVAAEAKTCYYKEISGIDAYVVENTYQCGTEGTACFVNGSKDEPWYMKYGTDEAWIMLPVAANAAGHVLCSIDTFGFDPLPNVHKHCSAGLKYDGIARWQICSGAEVPCSTDPSSVQLVRYGQGNDGSNYTFREVTAEKVNCGLDTFVVDPFQNVLKSCFVAVSSEPSLKIASVIGQWRLVNTHNGPTEFETEIGVTGSRAETKTSEWNVAVTAAVEVEADALFAKQKTTFSATASGGESTGLTRALEQTKVEKLKVSCIERPNAKNVGLFQWSYEVRENCAVAGTCAEKSNIQTSSTRCVYDPDLSLAQFRPVCRPACCADTNCTTCLDQPVCSVMVNPQFAD